MSKAEQFIREHTKNSSNRIDFVGGNDLVHHPWLFPNEARKAVEITEEEIYKWLQENAHKYSTVGLYTDAMITDLKQAMKDE